MIITEQFLQTIFRDEELKFFLSDKILTELNLPKELFSLTVKSSYNNFFNMGVFSSDFLFTTYWHKLNTDANMVNLITGLNVENFLKDDLLVETKRVVFLKFIATYGQLTSLYLIAKESKNFA